MRIITYKTYKTSNKYIKGVVYMLHAINDSTKRRGFQGALKDKRTMTKATKRMAKGIKEKVVKQYHEECLKNGI